MFLGEKDVRGCSVITTSYVHCFKY